jgi:hypothetical protein
MRYALAELLFVPTVLHVYLHHRVLQRKSRPSTEYTTLARTARRMLHHSYATNHRELLLDPDG